MGGTAYPWFSVPKITDYINFFIDLLSMFRPNGRSNKKSNNKEREEMSKTENRVATQVHTRKLDRQIAKNKLKEAGYSRVNSSKKFHDEWRKIAGK